MLREAVLAIIGADALPKKGSSMSICDRMDQAREIFFSQNPGLAAEIDAVNPAVIEACGTDIDAHKAQRRAEVFADAAKRRGIDAVELAIQLVAESPEQAHKWRMDRHRQTAEALGIDWEEYQATQ